MRVMFQLKATYTIQIDDHDTGMVYEWIGVPGEVLSELFQEGCEVPCSEVVKVLGQPINVFFRINNEEPE